MAPPDTVNDIVGQAQQGSVAAIIQILNERLADSGIRTRAILADGVLELLCEAATADQLPQQATVERVRSTLEELAPKHIRKVNINSRIVREQQLLWLEEITRDPENQLLWSELITLKRPNALARLWQGTRHKRENYGRTNRRITVPQSKGDRLKQRYFLRGLIGGVSLCIFLVLAGWALWHRWVISQAEAPAAPNQVGSSLPLPLGQDSFAQAVRLAEQAAADGQTADTAAAWLDLAARWKRASDLMAQVPSIDDRYITAQNRVVVYRQNHEQALLRAQQLRNADSDDDAPDPGQTVPQ